MGTDARGQSADFAALRRLPSCRVHTLEVPEPPTIDLREAASRAVRRPLASPPLSMLAAGKRRVVVVTSDATRAVPSRDLLGIVLEELAVAGVPADAIDLLIGGGAHRAPTQGELEAMLGRELLAQLHVHIHDAKASEVGRVGTSRRGTGVLVNRLVAEADLVIALGLVEPHEFAGFTGGPKAILPGVCAYETILANHSLEMLSHPQARCGEVVRNPIHQEMVEGADMARLAFVLNVAVDSALRPIAVAAGNHVEAQRSLVEFIVAHNSVELDAAPDVVVSVPGAPLDLNLYQSVKALAAIEPVLERRSAVVLSSACREGIGPPEVLAAFHGASKPEDVLARLSVDYCVEMNAALILARFLLKCPKLHIHSAGLSDAEIRTLQATTAPDLAVTVEHLVAGARTHKPCPNLVVVSRPQRLLLTLSAS